MVRSYRQASEQISNVHLHLLAAFKRRLKAVSQTRDPSLPVVIVAENSSSRKRTKTRPLNAGVHVPAIHANYTWAGIRV